MKRLCAILSVLIFAAAATAAASEYVWTGGARDGDYANPANWQGGQVPPAGDIHFAQTGSVFAVSGTGRVTISGSLAPASASVFKAQNAHVVFSSSSALSADAKIQNASGYAGYTQTFATSFANFLSRINAISDPNAIIGIDSTTPSVNRNVSDAIDLSRLGGEERHAPYYLGTSSRVTLTGNITPTLSPTGAGYDALYLAAVDDGYLKISSALGGPASPVSAVVIGQPSSVLPRAGTVELAGANTYSEGTRVLGGTLYVNASRALGSGAVAVAGGATFSTGDSANIANTIAFEPGSTFLANGTFTSRITIGPGVNFVPGGYGDINEIHMHGGITFQGGSIWNIDLGKNSAADLLCVWDSVIISANAQNPVYINLFSVGSSGEGAITGFDPTKSQTWTIAYRPGGAQVSIVGFDASYFSINASNFNQWNPNLGVFGIEQIGQSLAITFTPVPEPGTYALMAFGLGVLALLEIRRRRK